VTSAATSAPFTPFSGPFAIGTLSAPGESRFPGLVAPDGQVLDLRTALGEPALTTLALLERWDEELPRLHTLAGDPTRDWRPPADLTVHAPVEPRQIFQAGANYRQHPIAVK
jgi:hypothetical protein